jgi:hypothetical protein
MADGKLAVSTVQGKYKPFNAKTLSRKEAKERRFSLRLCAFALRVLKTIYFEKSPLPWHKNVRIS